MSAEAYTRVHKDSTFDYALNVLSKCSVETLDQIQTAKSRSLYFTPMHLRQDIMVDRKGAFSMTESRIAVKQAQIISESQIVVKQAQIIRNA